MENTHVNKKRGRKPKDKKNDKVILNESNVIISHLPINIEKTKNNNLNLKIEKKKEINEDNKLYCLSEDNLNHSKCWWCRYSFDTPKVTLPETFINNSFSTFGCFCSYNCALSYNISLNDENISKRTSLLYFFFKQTYNKHLKILRAPDWRVLEDFGGTISIDEYRNNFINNSYEFNYIKPPIISRIYQIEKILKKNNKSLKNDLVLKRTKPLRTNKYSLETTMGLKKIVNNNI